MGILMFKFFIGSLLLLVSTLSQANSERYYQSAWCYQQNGDSEVVLFDRTRVDCLTDKYAVEVDFAYKWAESIGQSLYYSTITGKLPAVLLIVGEGEHRFVRRFQNATMGIEIRLFTVDKVDN